jgi:hypothetical protein
MGNGLVFMAGRSTTAYLLNQSKLAGVGGQVAERSFCGSNVDGGEAFTTTVVYTPGLKGVVAVKVNAHTQDAGAVEHLDRFEWTADRGGEHGVDDPTRRHVVRPEKVERPVFGAVDDRGAFEPLLHTVGGRRPLVGRFIEPGGGLPLIV